MTNLNQNSHDADGDLDPDFDPEALLEDEEDLSDPQNLAAHLSSLGEREQERTDLSPKTMDEAMRLSGQ